jgi:hypothetical protein
LCGPLEALFTLLIFIITKELHAEPIQLLALTSAKPIVALVAYYCSSLVINNARRIKTFLIIATILGALPCLIAPWVENVWFYVIAYTLFMASLRSLYPAWIEALKLEYTEPALAKVVSRGAIITNLNTIFVSLLISYWMDLHPGIWKFFFVCVGSMQILAGLCIGFLQIEPRNYKEGLATPKIHLFLKESWNLLKSDRPFVKYLLLSFIGGAGVVIIQPYIPIFLETSLNLSYKQLALAFSFCKGVAFVVSSPAWVKFIKSASLYRLQAYINIVCVLFIAALLLAHVEVNSIYIAYIFYGFMLSGCELSWNLSGPRFAKDKDSILHSSMNLALIGTRGCFLPLLGYLAFMQVGVTGIFILSGILFSVSALLALGVESQYQKTSNVCDHQFS